ncbi:MAG: LapA family protein [Gallionella sp.]
MRYFYWFLRGVLFLVLLGFAFKNGEHITLRYFFGYEWQFPLVLALLIFFGVGAAFGVLAMMGKIFQQRREIARLKRDIKVKNKLAGVGETQKTHIQPS